MQPVLKGLAAHNTEPGPMGGFIRVTRSVSPTRPAARGLHSPLPLPTTPPPSLPTHGPRPGGSLLHCLDGSKQGCHRTSAPQIHRSGSPPICKPMHPCVGRTVTKVARTRCRGRAAPVPTRASCARTASRARHCQLSSGANIIPSEMSADYIPWFGKRTPGRVFVDTANRTFCHLWKRAS